MEKSINTPDDFKRAISENLGGYPFITHIYQKRLWNLSHSLSLINIGDRLRIKSD